MALNLAAQPEALALLLACPARVTIAAPHPVVRLGPRRSHSVLRCVMNVIQVLSLSRVFRVMCNQCDTGPQVEWVFELHLGWCCQCYCTCSSLSARVNFGDGLGMPQAPSELV